MNSTTIAITVAENTEQEFPLLSPPCVKINSQFILYMMIFLHYLGGLIAVSIGVHAILRYYWKSQKDMLCKLRISCIICTLFIISAIDAAIDFTFAVQCNKYSYNWFLKYDGWGTAFMLLGYYVLSCIFVYKVYLSFKDSILALSQSTIIFLVSLCVILVILVLIDNFLRYSGISEWGYTILMIALIIYIAGNAFLIKILISKLLSSVALAKEFETAGMSGSEHVSDGLYQTILKLFIVYSTAILSTLMCYSFIFILMMILNGTGHMIYLHATFRLTIIIDHICNIVCLLYQHDSADRLYKKTCCACRRCITKWCQNSIMHVPPAISFVESDIASAQSA